MGDALRVFSPSSTETASKCLRKWALRRAGWKPRIIQYPELCAVLGDGFSESMRVLNEFKREGVVQLPMAEIVRAGHTKMRQRLEKDQDAGRTIHEKDREFADLLPLRLDQAVNLYIAQYPLTDWTILQAEQEYPEHGKARLDLIARDVNGPAIFDYKVKVKFNPAWEDETLASYGRSQQRWHYQWMTGIERFYIILVVLEPKPKGKPYVKLSAPFQPSAYDAAGLHMTDSAATWETMSEYVDSALHAIPGALTHEDEWGECEYVDACLTHLLDERAMAVQYVKTERS